MPEKLTKKQKEAIRRAKEAEIDRKMREKVNKDFSGWGDKTPPMYPRDTAPDPNAPKRENPVMMKKGGMVRGHGCAKRGHKKLRMR